MMTIGITILGATGSIGKSTLDVIERHSERFRLVAVTANSSVDGMVDICRRFNPEVAVMVDPAAADELRAKLGESETEIRAGKDALDEVATLPHCNAVMAAIVGAAGLSPTLAAARAGKRVLLANKEALVMSGDLFMAEVRDHGAELLPIDSEHNAIFQSMPVDYAKGLKQSGVRKILLTASGGPFRTRSLEEMAAMTPAQAVAHPNWSMGQKISVDSATMMNKGLEIIEACWLFDTPADNVTVVVHPESIIHSMVEYVDGSVICQMGNPDMRIPIAHAMAWPDRIDSGVASLDLFEVAQLNFERPDETRFPCLRLAREAAKLGGTAPTILNAANEVAVQAFLDERIGFLDIAGLNDYCLSEITVKPADDLDVILTADAQARGLAEAHVSEIQGRQ